MDKIVGLTITKKSIKICELGIRRGKISILKLKEGNIGGLFGKDYESSIKRFFKINGIKTKKVSYGLSEEDVIIRINDYPKMPEDDLRKIILDEVESYKIFENDYPILNLIKLKEIENRVRYLIVVAPRKRVEEKLDFLKKIGLNPISIDVPSFASFRANKILRKDYFKGDGVFTFIGENKTTLIFFTNGEPLLLREFDIGLNSISENFETFRNEISNTLSYFSREEKKNIERIIISSIESGIEDFIQKIKEIFGIEVLFGAPLSDQPIYFSSSIGLSLISYEDKLKIDLIPKDIKERGKDQFKLIMLILSIILIGFLLIFLSIYLIGSIRTTNESIKEINNNLIKVEDSILNLKDVEKKYSELVVKQKEIDEILNKLQFEKNNEFIEKIFSSKTDTLKILNIRKQGESKYLITVLSNGFKPVFDFTKNLSNSGNYNEIKIQRMNRNIDGTTSSTIEVSGGEKWLKNIFQR